MELSSQVNSCVDRSITKLLKDTNIFQTLGLASRIGIVYKSVRNFFLRKHFMSFESLEKLEPILRSDWREKFSGNQNLFDLIENEYLAKFDSKQLKVLLYKSDLSRVFAEALLDRHYAKRKLVYKRTKRDRETCELQELKATIEVLTGVRNCYETEKSDLKEEIEFYKTSLLPQ